MPSATRHVQIPARESRDWGLPEKRDTVSLLELMVTATLNALPGGVLTTEANSEPLKSQPSTSISTRQKIKWVANARLPEELQVPASLMDVQWVDERHYPHSPRVWDLSERSIGVACIDSHEYCQKIVEKQLQLPPNRSGIRAMASYDHTAMPPGHRPSSDVQLFSTLEHMLCPYSNIEVKRMATLLRDNWNTFPFGKSLPLRVKPLVEITLHGLLCMLERIIAQADMIHDQRPSQPQILLGYALPPFIFHYIVVDYTQETVTVFENVVSPSSASLPHVGTPVQLEHATHREQWIEYWKAVLWFHWVAVAFNFPSDVDDALNADAQRQKKNLPADLGKNLNDTVRKLSKVPIASRWARICLRGTYLTRSLMAWFTDTTSALWTTCTWKVFGINLLRMSRSIRIPKTGTLYLRNDNDIYSPLYHWMPALLPDYEQKPSSCSLKRFYAYPGLNIFIKIFSPSAVSRFKNEVEIYDSLSVFQGKGIPRLYASGKISCSDEYALVMSHEGESLERWDIAEQWDISEQIEVVRLVSLLHRYNIHHHDVAARNVLVDHARKFTLIDFESAEKCCTREGCTEAEDSGIAQEPDRDSDDYV